MGETRRGRKSKGEGDAPKEEALRGDDKGHGNGGWWSDGRREGKFRILVPFGHGRREERRASSAVEAERVWQELIDLRDSGLNPDGATKTLDDLIAEYIEKVIKARNHSQKPYAPNTVQDYLRTFTSYLSPNWGKYRLPEFKKVQLILDIHHKLTVEFSPYIANKAITKLHMLLDAAVRWDYLESNAAQKARPQLPNYETPEKVPLTIEETHRLLVVVRNHRLAGLYGIALVLGLRLGELLGLHWDDIDWEKKTITVQRQIQEVFGKKILRDETKTGKLRVLPLTPKLEQYLRTTLHPVPSPYLFPSEDVTPLAPSNFHRHYGGGETGGTYKNGKPKTIEGMRNKAGLPETATPHTFRHTVATRLLDLGIEGEIRDKILGHGKKGIRGRYAHATMQAMRKALVELETLTFGED